MKNKNTYNNLVDTKSAAKLLELNVSTLERLRRTNEGPVYNTLDGTIVYLVKDLREWALSRTPNRRNKKGFQELIADIPEGSIAITFVTNCEQTNGGYSHRYKRKQYDRLLKKFDAMMMRKFLGKKWNKSELRSQRQTGLITCEHESSNIHYHTAVYIKDIPLDEYVAAATTIWKRLAPRGDLKFVPIHNREGWANYMTKDISGNRLTSDVNSLLFFPPLDC